MPSKDVEVFNRFVAKSRSAIASSKSSGTVLASRCIISSRSFLWRTSKSSVYAFCIPGTNRRVISPIGFQEVQARDQIMDVGRCMIIRRGQPPVGSQWPLSWTAKCSCGRPTRSPRCKAGERPSRVRRADLLHQPDWAALHSWIKTATRPGVICRMRADAD